MKLLNEIVAGAVQPEGSLAALLRQSLVLAHELKNEELERWCLGELNGYDGASELPPARRLLAESRGFMLGRMGAKIYDQPLSLHVVEERDRDQLLMLEIRQGVAELEALVRDHGGGQLQVSWPAHLVVKYQMSFDPRWVLNRAWQVLPTQTLVGICDRVRNNMLQFALAIRKKVGDAPAPLEVMSVKEVEAKVTQIFFGGGNIVNSTVSGGAAQLGNAAVFAGDFDGLRRVLAQGGVPEAELKELEKALQTDGSRYGEATESWAKRVSAAVGGGLAVEAIAAAIKAFLGVL
ncbi:hypothetical protein [Bosea sp. (in: a-proteobacteria)]|uniref:AbiTii domain-containing protein n=1 Tax=Bosea sp. (in: a-proteobacteria) TaxID=1871050 RepID=UPI001AD51850|nr:hypothetical protein [Bosea sp. (in: a-proteobacteria)]MBN9438786.1 hypothetical protein [Bosea sp. (in: a-proteobacteria)]